jgi:bifunctional UDP-N-acetylglucosamine pyrophosphorylase / glucosamine-1-phosphate N-acetyltransferase
VPAGVSGHVPARAGAGVRREAGTLRASSIRPVTAPTVVILAAGQGTRMRSRTPKVLHDLCGQPMIAWPVAAALAAGAGKVVVVDGPDRPLEGKLPDDVELAIQSEPNGTGGAVQAAASHLTDAPVLVLNGDVPLVTAEALTDLLEAHAQRGAQATVASMELDDPAGYGRVVRREDGSVERVVETKVAGDATAQELAIREVNAGVYAFDGAALADALERLTPDNAQGELYLPSTVELLDRVAAHPLDDPTLLLGVNDRVDLARVRALAQARIHRAHMRAGVTIVDPASTLVDATVAIGADTVIEPSSFLRGRTMIGAGCAVGPLTTLIDTTLGDHVRVPHSYLVECEVRAGASVGPFAYLRPGTLLRERAKAGTFVEIKNSDIGEGTKVPHLSYIGDADVGPNTNLGAATITANYDGTRKHRTTIGADVRTSVDTTLVAPVTIGDGAYVGANSAITEDVPPGALGIARERQTNIEGYAERKKKREAPDTPS